MKFLRNAFAALGWVVGYLASIAGGSAVLARLLPEERLPAIVGNVTIVVTGLIILWYTWETRRLRLESHAQVAVSRKQAKIAEQMFEASHRPFVEISFYTQSFVGSGDWYYIRYHLVNHGHVPAIVSAPKVRILSGDREIVTLM